MTIKGNIKQRHKQNISSKRQLKTDKVSQCVASGASMHDIKGTGYKGKKVIIIYYY